jgi:NADPH2:quinone reductase
MQAVVLEGIGGPEQLVLRELPPPAPEDGQIVVEVKAVAINFLEILIRRGLYPQMPALPWIPGTEIAGVTEDGRRVIGLVRSSGGGYAELAAVDEQWLFDLPAGASFEQGAAFLMAYLTAWIPLTRQVVIHPGARVLVHAAAGGVGSAAVVVARDLGAAVVATAGSDDKLALPLSLGARQAVTYDRLEEIEPVDVVFDPVGGKLFADSIKLLRPLGAAIAIGFAGGLWQPVDPALLVGRNIGIQGFYLGRLMQRQPEVVREAATDLLRLWSAGQVRPIVGSTFPLAEAAEAHRLVESRRSSGKVVLVP